MKVSKYKRGLLSENPKEFCNTLKELKSDLQLEQNMYGCLKRINKFLCDSIENIDSSEIIENELYRIIPSKYSFIYILAIALQTEIEVAEREIKSQKYNRMYSYTKRIGKNPEKITEIMIMDHIIPYILLIIEPFTNEKMYGYKDIYEIEKLLNDSNLVKALNRVNLLEEQEEKLRWEKEEEVWKNGIPAIDDFDKHFSDIAKNKRIMIESSLEDNILKSKITILHVPLFHKINPSIYLSKINSILVAEYMGSDVKESRLLSEFGMYLQHRLTGDMTILPIGFKLVKDISNPMEKANLFFDLFAYKVMEGTSLESKNTMKKQLKLYPSAMKDFLKDASYFDILVND
ncbi:MAG: hypothetical protein IJH34_14395 [Romboutsia sp.]|nr:hypothetical protein [Romboutsia sp.]